MLWGDLQTKVGREYHPPRWARAILCPGSKSAPLGSALDLSISRRKRCQSKRTGVPRADHRGAQINVFVSPNAPPRGCCHTNQQV